MVEKNTSILLVDDDDIDREAVKRWIKKEDLPYNLQTAKTEQEVIRLMQDEVFDLVLLDYDLGTTTGLEILTQIDGTPVIFITGRGSEEIAVAALQAGAYDYLIKDSERNYLKILPQTIENMLARKRIENELLKSQIELEASQSLLDSIIKTVPEIIYRLDDDSMITFISESVKNYGYEPTDLLGKSIFDIVHPEDIDNVTHRINERRTGERSADSFEVRLLKKDRTTVPFEIFSISATGLYEPETEESVSFMGTQGVARDITERKKADAEREKMILELTDALDQVKSLSGLLPICASCKKIRDDKGYWNQIETYIEKHSDAQFSHGICQECAEKLYGDSTWYKNMNKEK